jgi:hypothetical protein
VRHGAACTVAVTLDSSDECRAQVLCGDVAVYPRDGDGGFFATCDFDDARQVTHGTDVNTTDLDGDPRIDFDRARRTVVVSDGPSPSWEVSIRFARAPRGG